MAADAGALAHAVDRVSSLPAALILNIFSRLSADERARCATVCRSWCTAVSEPSLWTRLDLSVTSGVTCTLNRIALVASTSRAGGRLEALDLSGRSAPYDFIRHKAVLAVARANSDTLRELRWGEACNECFELEGVLRAAPHLHVLETGAYVEAADAGRMLRNEAPFGPLRLTGLGVHDQDQFEVDAVFALAAGVVAHAVPLVSLTLDDAPFHNLAVLDAVVDAVLARRVRRVEFTGDDLGFSHGMGLVPACAPALARLLGGDALEELQLSCCRHDRLLDEHAAALLGAALRANTTLTHLRLDSALSHNAAAAVVVLLRALEAHPSLRKLELTNNRFPDVGHETYHALGALVAANAPSLRELSVRLCNLNDMGLAPLVNALRGNTHLRVLHCHDNDMSDAFARDVLLPAVRANTSLRELRAMTKAAGPFEMGRNAERVALAHTFQDEAQALVTGRGGDLG
jgi:hypothetical protein